MNLQNLILFNFLRDSLARPNLRISQSSAFRRMILESIDSRLSNNLNSPPRFVLKILRLLSKVNKPDKSYIRFILTRFFPWDPLRKFAPDVIDVFVLTHEKDLLILPYTLLALMESVGDQINSINVIAPLNSIEVIKNKTSNLSKYVPFNLITDEELFSRFESESTIKMSSVPKMEILKLICALQSQTGKTLVLDGDTLLLRRRTWVSGNSLVIPVAQEYLLRHINFNRNFFNLDSNVGLGFVTHHQLLIKSEVKRVIALIGGEEKLMQVFDNAYTNFSEKNNVFPSEWQLIGDWMYEKSDYKIFFVSFINLGMSRNHFAMDFLENPTIDQIRVLIEFIRRTKPFLGSLSFHAYK